MNNNVEIETQRGDIGSLTVAVYLKYSGHFPFCFLQGPPLVSLSRLGGRPGFYPGAQEAQDVVLLRTEKNYGFQIMMRKFKNQNS